MLSIKQSLKINNKSGKITLLLTTMATLATPAFAAGGPEPSILTNPLALTLILLMGLLLIVIAVLANILVGAADWKLKLKKKEKTISAAKPVATILLLLATSAAFGQEAPAEAATATSSSIGGLAMSTFYIMASVIFLELAIILVLLINIRFLIRAARDKEAAVAERVAGVKPEPARPKRTLASIWSSMNRFKAREEEKEIEMAHEYDGIRELDNRLPPWWLWGFYITIIFAVVYLWRYHVSETAPLSEEEYKISVARAEAEVEEYLKQKGESVNENTVTLLTDAADIAGGAKIFGTSCVACHGAKGEGNVVGPNLTDEYWLHGGDIKSIFKTIKYGVDGKGMASWQSTYSPRELAQLASYIKSIGGSNPAGAKEPQGVLYKEDAAAPTSDSLKTDNAAAAVQ